MRLISIHTDVVRALERLRVPFDDLTPEGLWASSYHLVGVTAEQRAVLDTWNLDVNDVTPEVLVHAGDLSPQLKESWPAQSARASRPAAESTRKDSVSDIETAVPMHEEPKRHGDKLEREIVTRAAAEAESKHANAASHPASNGASGATSAAPPNAAADGRGSEPVTNGHTAAFTSPSSATDAGGPAAASIADATPAAAAAEKSDPKRLRVSVGGKYREASVQSGKILLDGKTFDSPAHATKSVAAAKGDWVFWEYYDSDAGKWRMLDRDWRPSTAG
jgi:hypothetical protein